MAARVRIKAGSVEFEYEGETELGVADIKDLFSHIEALFKVPVLSEDEELHEPSVPAAPVNDSSAMDGGGPKLHINNVAQKLKAKTAPELAIVAAATLQIYDGKETFSRTDLLDTMKKAKGHYKTSMSGNLTKTLGRLVGPKFNQVSDGMYSLTSDELQKLEAQLA